MVAVRRSGSGPRTLPRTNSTTAIAAEATPHVNASRADDLVFLFTISRLLVSRRQNAAFGQCSPSYPDQFETAWFQEFWTSSQSPCIIV